MSEQIEKQREIVRALFLKRMEADNAYIKACKELAILEQQQDQVDDSLLHWHPPRYPQLSHYGEDD